LSRNYSEMPNKASASLSFEAHRILST